MELQNLKAVVDAAYGSPLPEYGHLLPIDTKIMMGFDGDIKMAAEVVLVGEYEGRQTLVLTNKNQAPLIMEQYNMRPIFTYYTDEEKRQILGG